jgi:hypothetical protein
MSNFAYLFENMDRARKHEQEYVDGQALEAITNGMNVDENFWANFLSVLNNSEALSNLLGIPSVKMNKWRGRIQKYLTKYYDTQGEEPDLKKKRKFVDISDIDY